MNWSGEYLARSPDQFLDHELEALFGMRIDWIGDDRSARADPVLHLAVHDDRAPLDVVVIGIFHNTSSWGESLDFLTHRVGPKILNDSDLYNM